jgi:hypothetical protein
MDCDGQWLHRVGTTHNLFVGKRCISSVNWWQQLLSRVWCGNLLALQRRTCRGRTRVPAQSVSATFHPLTHATCCQHFTCGGARTGGAHAGAHIPGAQMPGRAAGYIASARRNRLGDSMLEGMLVAKCNRDLLD